MLVEAVGGTVCAAAALMAYGVRGCSATLLGSSVHRGPAGKRALALTFDDGPSESTPELLKLLDRHRVKATFFQCGMNVRRLPQVAGEVAAAGHDIGNHSDSHPLFCFRSPSFLYDEVSRAQEAIHTATGETPAFFRAPYGVRWFGLRRVQQRLGLLGVMWTAIGLDWKRQAEGIVARLLRGARNGAILCLHDGRTTQTKPDIRETVEAVRRLTPALLERGFRFETISKLLCPTT